MDRLAKIRARIRQLRRMTVANGCSEHEAMRAAEIAMRLLGKYGLHEDDVANELSPQPTFGRRRQVVDNLWSVVAKITGCEGFFTRGDWLRFVYFGRPADVAVAEYLHDLLDGAFRRECADFRGQSEYLRRRKRKTRAAAMKAFQQAMVARLRRRLFRLWWRRAAASGDTAGFMDNSAGHLGRLSADLARRGHSFKTMVDLSLPDRRFDDSRVAGYAAGGRVGIEPGVGAGGVAGLLTRRT